MIRFEDPLTAFSTPKAPRGAARGAESGEDPLHRLHRPQGPAHSSPHADSRAGAGFTFDAVQMPLNLMDTHYRSFERLVLPQLVKSGIGVLGMKSMANGVILKSGTVDSHRVPSLRAVASDFGRDHGHRIDGASGGCPRRRAHISSAGQARWIELSSEDGDRRLTW